MISSPNSYFTTQESLKSSEPVFIFTLGGNEIPQEDIIDPGQLSMSRPDSFSDINASDITIILNNETGIYSPGRSDFLFAGSYWWHQDFKVEFGYKRPGFAGVIDKITIFEGVIIDWSIKETKDYSFDAPLDGLTAEITANDHIYLLRDRLVGKPTDDGDPAPFCHGRIFRQAEELGCKTLGWSADESIDYETGNLTQIDYVSNGATTVSTTDPHGGTYCGKHETTTGTYCRQDVYGASGDGLHVSGWFKFDAAPVDPDNENMRFLGIYNNSLGNAPYLTVGGDASPHDLITLETIGWGSSRSNIRINSWLGVWVKIDLMFFSDQPNNQAIVKVFFNNQSIITMTKDTYDSNFPRYVFWGLILGSSENGWRIYTDDIKCYKTCYPTGYYLPGFPYDSIDAVYVDSGFWPRYNRIRHHKVLFNHRWVNTKQYTGRDIVPANYDVDLDYGLVNFNTFSELPSGNIILDATKDTTEHPVDDIESILTEVDLDSLIDSTNFAAVKTALPDDTIGLYLDNISSSEGIARICEICLYHLVEKQGAIFLIPYTGTALGSSVKTLNRSNCYSFEQAVLADDLITEVTTKWAWYDRDNRLFYRTQDAGAVSQAGEQTEDRDLSFGQDITTDSEDMAKDKADLFLKRKAGPVDQITASGDLSLIRVELGDGVTIVNTNFNDSNLIYEVYGKNVDLTNKTVELTLKRFLGES